MVKVKHILIGAGAAALIFGVPYLIKVKRLSDELETVTKLNIYKVSLTGIDLKIDVTLKNPSNGSITIKYPFVKLLYKDSTIASSQVTNQDIKIPEFGEIQLDPIMVNLGFITLATTVPALLKEYRAQGQLTLAIKTITTINNRLPYTKTDNMVIGAKA